MHWKIFSLVLLLLLVAALVQLHSLERRTISVEQATLELHEQLLHLSRSSDLMTLKKALEGVQPFQQSAASKGGEELP